MICSAFTVDSCVLLPSQHCTHHQSTAVARMKVAPVCQCSSNTNKTTLSPIRTHITATQWQRMILTQFSAINAATQRRTTALHIYLHGTFSIVTPNCPSFFCMETLASFHMTTPSSPDQHHVSNVFTAATAATHCRNTLRNWSQMCFLILLWVIIQVMEQNTLRYSILYLQQVFNF